MLVREVRASVGQRLLWLLDHYRGENGALNCPVLCRLRGALDPALLDQALHGLALRHESLRTGFTGRGPNLRQRILDGTGHVLMHQVDLTGTAALEQAVAGELRHRIDPAGEPVRVTLWRVAEDDHVLCLNMHHLITDAWSNRILFDDLMGLLGRSALPAAGWQYAEFSEWQHEQLQSPQMQAHHDYWRGRLAGAEPPTIPQLAAASARSSRSTSSLALDIDPPVVESLRGLARQCRTTLFCAALSVHYALLLEVAGQHDLTVASLFANRAQPPLRRTVGFLANMVLLRTTVPARASFVDLLRATHRTVAEAFVHQSAPFHLLATGTRTGDPARVDDIVFQVIPDPLYTARVAELDVEVLVPEGVSSRFDLELVLVAREQGYRAVLFFNPERVPAPFAGELLTGYAALARAVTARPVAPLNRLRRRWDGSDPALPRPCGAAASPDPVPAR